MLPLMGRNINVRKRHQRARVTVQVSCRDLSLISNSKNIKIMIFFVRSIFKLFPSILKPFNVLICLFLTKINLRKRKKRHLSSIHPKSPSSFMVKFAINCISMFVFYYLFFVFTEKQLIFLLYFLASVLSLRN